MSNFKISFAGGTKIELEASDKVLVDLIEKLHLSEILQQGASLTSEETTSSKPTKKEAITTTTTEKKVTEQKPKRGRGRPRKHPISEIKTTSKTKEKKALREAPKAKSEKKTKKASKAKIEKKKTTRKRKSTGSRKNLLTPDGRYRNELAMEKLLKENFFAGKKLTVLDVCEELARRGTEFKGREIYPILVEYTKTKSFMREKNSNGEWVYFPKADN